MTHIGSAQVVESARRAHHLQNPQNRPWSRFVTGSLISPLAGWGRVGLVGWKPNSRRHHGRALTQRGGGADNSCSPPRQLRKQPDGPSLTIPGAVTGFEGFEGAGHAIA